MKELLAQMAIDPAEFRRHLVIDEQGTKLGDVLEPWQRADFEAMDNALLEAAGRKPYDPSTIRYSWQERPRGHSKSSDAAAAALWFLLFARGAFPIIVAAADRDQAKLVRDAIDRLVKLNPWIGGVVKVNSFEILGRSGSKLSVISCDVGSSFGATPRLVIADEVCHWPQSTGEELWGSLFSSAGKRRECCVLSISNAGMVGTWTHQLRDRIQNNPAWRFSRLEGPQASWITPAVLEQQQRLLLPKQFQRLWLNQWTDQEGDAIEPELIDRAIDKTLSPMERAEPGFVYVAGVDVGLTSDATGLVVLAKDPRAQRVRLAKVRLWKPTKKISVSLSEVEAEIRELHRAFRFAKVLIDPFQTIQMIERLKNDRLPVEAMPVNSAFYSKSARNVLSAFSDGLVQLFDNFDLVRDLRAMSLIEQPPGNVRLVLPKTDAGHCDAGMAFLLALDAAQKAYAPSTNLGFKPLVVTRNHLGSSFLSNFSGRFSP